VNGERVEAERLFTLHARSVIPNPRREPAAGPRGRDVRARVGPAP
jgi:hypothetical protein